MKSTQSENISISNTVQIVGMNLKPVLNELHILSQSKLLYSQNEGAMSRLWEIWIIEELAWGKIDTMEKDKENHLMFNHNAWWINPYADDKFKKQILLIYGKPNCEFEIDGKEIFAWYCENKKINYSNLLEYFHEELDEWNSETIVKMCVLLSKANGWNLLGLFKTFQKEEVVFYENGSRYAYYDAACENYDVT